MKSKHYHYSYVIVKRIIVNIKTGAPDIFSRLTGSIDPFEHVSLCIIKCLVLIKGSCSIKAQISTQEVKLKKGRCT